MSALYELAPAASRDLEHILHEGLMQFGIEQARRYRSGMTDAFALLAAFPRSARLRHEIERPIRVHRFEAHLILYDIVDDGSILIIRIRHGREDWQVDVSSH